MSSSEEHPDKKVENKHNTIQVRLLLGSSSVTS
jgi:hypothetical protein